MKILVTGAAGFIGFHVTQTLLKKGHHIYGLDNLNDYYDVELKHARLRKISDQDNFTFEKLDLNQRSRLFELFTEQRFDQVIHLAAQAGIRYSLENPYAYIESNINGFINILEGCRHHNISHLIYASSSSVYGRNTKVPFSVKDRVDHPISLYAATKRSNELMAETYSHLYSLAITGLRFFTVYGPWGRPDMAYFKFTSAILKGQPIDVYNHGKMQRDLTYIDDVVEALCRVIESPPCNCDGTSQFPSQHRLYNIGNHSPISLMHLIETIEKETGQLAQKRFKPMQAGDVQSTYADVSELIQDFNFSPQTSLETGIHHFVQWYQSFYHQGKTNS